MVPLQATSEDTAKHHWICPDYIAVIGGGRWARVLVESLANHVPSSVSISVRTPSNTQGMSEWASSRGLSHRISVSAYYPDSIVGKRSAVLVANAARDHAHAIEWALHRHLPVLAEKPVTLSFASTSRLYDIAHAGCTYLAAAHVFLFARYVSAFSLRLCDSTDIQTIKVQWEDPPIESRYGEAKCYDAGLTIYADWLPHVLSILGALLPNPIRLGQRLEVFRGGSHIKIEFLLGNIPCEIELVRNGAHRQRRIEVFRRIGTDVLDFSTEPGIIASASSIQCGDPTWDAEPKPVVAMLRAFLQSAESGIHDKRLDIGIGMQTNLIIDQVTLAYNSAIVDWLRQKFMTLKYGVVDSDLHYALTEILHRDDPLSSIPDELRVEHVYCQLRGVFLSSVFDQYESRPKDLFNALLKKFTPE